MEEGLIRKLDLGSLGEEEACTYLKKQRWKIVARNFRVPEGEIDIISRRGKLMIFVEVKTRSSAVYGQPWEAVGHRKRKRLKTAAGIYIHEHSLQGDLEFRFDVISITLDDALKPKLEWIQDAF